jgi:enoyl-CoA hydratase/carnithine racemase
MIELPVPTVAALQGHTFAAGAMLALCHDFRVMRTDRGFFCLPEVDIHIPFTPGMASLIQSRLRKQIAHELMTTGRRVGGADALPLEIVDLTADEGEVRPAAIVIAQRHVEKASPTLGLIKSTMYAGTIALLREDVPDLHPPVTRVR